MAFDGRFEEADGPGEAWAEQELRKPGKQGADAGVSAEPRGREEYYEALQVADSGEPPGDDELEADEDKPRTDGNESEGQDGDHADAGADGGGADGGGKNGATDAKADAAQNGDAQADKSSAWDNVDAAKRPPIDATRVTPERQKHILDGDDTSGGHRHGTGKPGKTEFPASWSDAKVNGLLEDVARRPDETPIHQDNGRWFTTGKREEVEIVAIVKPDAQVWSGWPLPGGPGVVQNPKET
jgi:Bacterial EndoU nuclease